MTYVSNLNIPKDKLVELSKSRYYLSVLNLIVNWLIIGSLAFFIETQFNLFIYIVSVILISARMHAISTLAHEATHFMLLKNKKWNDRITEWFITLPLFFSLKMYRNFHLTHHVHLNTDKDPDTHKHKTYKEFQFPLKKRTMLLIFLLDISGINFFRYKLPLVFTYKFWLGLINATSFKGILFYSILTSIILIFNLEFVFLKFWLIPYFTWFQFVNRVRTIAEHNAVSVSSGTRTTLTSLIDVILIGPNNSNYHAEHHLFPSVPFYNLPLLHKILMKKSEFKLATHFSKGYFSVIKECVS